MSCVAGLAISSTSFSVDAVTVTGDDDTVAVVATEAGGIAAAEREAACTCRAITPLRTAEFNGNDLAHTPPAVAAAVAVAANASTTIAAASPRAARDVCARARIGDEEDEDEDSSESSAADDDCGVDEAAIVVVGVSTRGDELAAMPCN